MTIEVAIISQFRPELLERCLVSLQDQIKLPNRIILVLHPRDNESKKLVKEFKGLKFLVRFYGQGGWAPLRNLALQASKGDFLYFVDDDCFLSPKAVKSAYELLLTHNEYIAVQGKSVNIDNGFYSQFAQWTNDLWLDRLWDKKTKTLGSLDTKNVCFRREGIESFSFWECFGSEDVDFGLQISSRGGKIGLNPKMIAFHQEQATDLLTYFKKRLRMMKGLAVIKKKWEKLPYFYNLDQDYETKICQAFQRSKYKESIRYRLFLETVFLLRKLRKVYDSLVFRCESNI